MSARWLLEEIVEELGEIPYNKFSDIFNQVVAQLIKTPKTIIVDETDYLTIDSRAVETLRDIHDKTNVPIVLVGMGTANKRLQRHKRGSPFYRLCQKIHLFQHKQISANS